MAQKQWSIGTEYLVEERRLLRDRVVVYGPDEVERYEQRVSASGAWQVPIAGRVVKVTRRMGLEDSVVEVFGSSGETIPMTPTRLCQIAAPEGSRCATHTEITASYACLRCGTFVCGRCEAADLIHCRTCLAPRIEASKAAALELAYFAPAAVFAYAGGIFGAVFGVLAGAAAYAVARRTRRGPAVIAAIGLYLLAALVTLMIARLFPSWLGP